MAGLSNLSPRPGKNAIKIVSTCLPETIDITNEKVKHEKTTK
jgi:hypothetical protein